MSNGKEWHTQADWILNQIHEAWWDTCIWNRDTITRLARIIVNLSAMTSIAMPAEYEAIEYVTEWVKKEKMNSDEPRDRVAMNPSTVTTS